MLCYVHVTSWYVMVCQNYHGMLLCHGMPWYVMSRRGMLWYVMLCYSAKLNIDFFRAFLSPERPNVGLRRGNNSYFPDAGLYIILIIIISNHSSIAS